MAANWRPPSRTTPRVRWCAPSTSSSATPARRKSVTAGELEDGLRDLVTNWQDRFVAEARTASAVDFAVARRYQSAFSAGYRENFSPARALEDVRRLEALGDANPVAIDFYRDAGTPPTEVRVALYRLDSPIPLSERVPVFENFGFKVIDERSYRLKPLIGGAPRQVLLHDMVLQRRERRCRRPDAARRAAGGLLPRHRPRRRRGRPASTA